MPIIIKDYTWKQTSDSITIQVPLRSRNSPNVDIIIASRYIKASYEQTYFEAILLEPIERAASKCTITPTEIIFELKKTADEEWNTLEPDIPKAERLQLKKELLEEFYQETQKECEEKLGKNAELKRVAVRKQIETDTLTRNTIENIRKHEEATALGDIAEWEKSISRNAKLPHLRRKAIKQKSERVETSEPIQPRTAKTLQIEFTPREFPTPSRESRLEEENEWLTKQAEARRSAGFVSEDIRPEERNPQFIKAKGDEFLKNKNYLGAISAYSFGIKISKNFVDFYISRAEAHFAVGNFHKVLQDCSSAIDLLKPECASNLKERAQCIGRRGEALCKLGMKKQGTDELKFSLKLMKNDHFQNVLEKESCTT
nr:dynein assembly factor 4, axonemal-like [Leptinotarsa decemlineata]